MYKLEVDVDGVLLNIDTELEKELHADGYTKFSMENVKTYDFNKSLGNEVFSLPSLGVLPSTIVTYYRRPSIFENAVEDREAIELLCKLGKTGRVEIRLVTVCFSDEIADIKRKRFSKYFEGIPNISLEAVVGFMTKKESAFQPDGVVEDSYENLLRFDNDVHLYLVNRGYNTLYYNPQIRLLTCRPYFERCKDTAYAIRQFCKDFGLSLEEE